LRLLKNIIVFQRKIFFLSYIISIGVGLLFGGELTTIGLSFFIIAPFTQYFLYEMNNKNQYYYYYNLGLSKLSLWISTLIISLINLLVLILL